MYLDWTEDQIELYEKIFHAVKENFGANEIHQDQFWSLEQWRLCGELGLLGLCVPTQYQGGGYDALTTAKALEAFGRGCPDMGLVFSSAAHLFACCMPLIEYGREETKRRLLPDLCSGKSIGANAITEQDAGSDIFAMSTHATRDGDSYILTGTKSYVSNGPVADVFVVYAITNPDNGYFGSTCFIVERNSPGIAIGTPFCKIGLTSTPACQIHFYECRVPAVNRIGKEGQGALIFKRAMQWERSCLFASYIGQLERQLEQTIWFAQRRRQFGKPIGKNQAIAHRLADMKLRLEAARLLLYRACWLFDHGRDAQLAIALSKLAISEAAIKGGMDAIQIHGSVGVNCEFGIERMLRDAIPSTIFSGTSEMQRDIIASELGL